MKRPYSTINPSGSASNFTTLAAAVAKARANAKADDMAQVIYWDNHGGRLLVHPDGSLELEDTYAHTIDWTNQMAREGVR